MSDNQLKYLMEHADEIVPVLYDHARKLAARYFRWRPGKTLPLGKTPEDIVTDVFERYMLGEGGEQTRTKGVRHFDPAKDIMLQLKGSVRSLMSALRDKSSTRNELLAQSEEEAAQPVEQAPTAPTPAEMADSKDFAKAVVEGVKAHPKFESSQELQDLLAAWSLEITGVEEQAKELGKTDTQIHQLNFRLRTIIREVIDEVNKS